MNGQKITLTQFDAGIELLLKILAAQPGMLKLEPGTNETKGKQLADMAVAFSKQLQKLTDECCGR